MSTTPPNPSRVHWKKRVKVAATTLLVVGLLFELGFRVFVTPRKAPPLRFQFAGSLEAEARSLESVYAPSESRFWALEPGQVEPYGGDVINTLGMRGPEPAPEAAETYRLAVLGDSCTYGVKSGLPHTYGARLEERLRELRPSLEVEVLNGGVPGYTLYQGLRLFDERIEALRPDLIILYFGAWNDFGAAFGASDRARGEEGVRPVSAVEFVYQKLSWLRTVQWFGDRYAGTLRHRHWRETVNAALAGEAPDGSRVPLDDFDELLEQLLVGCERIGADVVIVLPELQVIEGQDQALRFQNLGGYRAALAAAVERRGLVAVDQRMLFPAALHGELFMDPVHPSAAGNVWLAHALADVIIAQGLLGETSSESVDLERRGLSCRERTLDASAGGTLHVELDLGEAHAGARATLLAALTPEPYRLNAGAPEHPLRVDELTPALTPPGRHELTLDARGRGTFSVEVPAALPALAGRRAVGFAARLVASAGTTWVGEVWVPVDPGR